MGGRVSVLAVVLVLVAAPVMAQGISGPEVGWTRLADTVLLSAESLGMIVPVIALAMLGAAILFSLQLAPVVQVLIGCSVLVLGATAFNSVMGAELVPIGALP